MTNNQFTTPTLGELIKEINERAKKGFLVKSGPDFADGMYTVSFEAKPEADPEVEVVVPPAPQPAAPAQAKPQRGPKPKAKAAEQAKELAEA